MKGNFKDYIVENSLCNINDRILIAISGGIDSMVLLNLFIHNKFENIAVAHCNFNLRGNESDSDQDFIEKYCKQHSIDCYTKSFDTTNYASEKKISVQMAARDLRYEWFNEIRNEHNYSFIAIAHNLNDSVETFLMNMSRGTGIKGLIGIKPKDEKSGVIRPILFATRREIQYYAENNNIPFREDSSNASTKYTRNFFRHTIIGEIEKRHPNFLFSANETIQNLKEVDDVYQTHLKALIEQNTVTNKGQIAMDLSALIKLPYLKTLLHEFLHPFGFHRNQISKVLKAYNNQPGKRFDSITHTLVIDRQKILVQKREEITDKEIIIKDENATIIEQPLPIRIKRFTKDELKTLKTEINIGLVDADKLKFPLIFRKWQEGDHFYPLGMKGKKKLSDYFKDEKMTLFEKNDTWLLCDGKSDEIVWVVGKRLSDKYKITGTTRNVIKFEVVLDV